jgi:signal transduction histidine kinase
VQTALAVIKDASKEALVELRSLVGVLRDEADVAPRTPTATLDSLDDLVERSALAGREVNVTVVGDVVALPAAVELAAFRIVQEAVTNVIRHASAHHAEIVLDYGSSALAVQIDDDGVGGLGNSDDPDDLWSSGTGSGLRGMRERANILGGSLRVGSAPLGGVRIRAVLPVGTAP